MQREVFRDWLKHYGKNGKSPMSKRPIDDALSRCSRVEKSLNIDLDIEFNNRRDNELIALLQYSADDERMGKKSVIKFENGANIKNGMASLRNAVRKYFEFCYATKLN